jgi:hypothetical protein
MGEVKGEGEKGRRRIKKKKKKRRKNERGGRERGRFFLK